LKILSPRREPPRTPPAPPMSAPPAALPPVTPPISAPLPAPMAPPAMAPFEIPPFPRDLPILPRGPSAGPWSEGWDMDFRKGIGQGKCQDVFSPGRIPQLPRNYKDLEGFPPSLRGPCRNHGHRGGRVRFTWRPASREVLEGSPLGCGMLPMASAAPSPLVWAAGQRLPAAGCLGGRIACGRRAWRLSSLRRGRGRSPGSGCPAVSRPSPGPCRPRPGAGRRQAPM